MKKEMISRIEIVKMATAVAVVFLTRTIVWAQSTTGTSTPPPRPPGGHGLFLGVCVGQTLAAEGITLTLPVKGQAPTPPDATTQAAFDAAIKTCIASLPQPPPPPSATTSSP